MKKIYYSLITLIICVWSTIAAPGDLDPTFDGDGKLLTQLYISRSIPTDSALQPDGKIVVVGTHDIGGTYALGIARYLTDGTLDASFANGGRLVLMNVSYSSYYPFDVVTQTDGKILIAGSTFDQDFTIVRLNDDGTLDTTFDGDGIRSIDVVLTFDEARSIVAMADGRILIGGVSWQAGRPALSVVRLLTNGALDATFGTAGKTVLNIFEEVGELGAVNPIVTSIAIAPDNKIVAVGKAGASAFPFRQYQLVARLSSGGTLDATFDGNGIVLNEVFAGEATVAVQTDSKILCLTIGGVRRYNIDGTIDASFNGGSVQFTSSSNGEMKIQPDGNIVISGARGVGIGLSEFIAARLLIDGSFDVTFGINGTRTVLFDGDINAGRYPNVIQPDGKILVSGMSRPQFDEFTTLRLNSDGTTDLTFSGDGYVSTDVGEVESIGNAVMMDANKIAVVGTFNNLGQRWLMVSRFLPNGVPDTSFDLDGKRNVVGGTANIFGIAGAIQPDGKIIAVGEHSSPTTGKNFDVWRFQTNGDLDPTFRAFHSYTLNNDAPRAVALQSDGNVVVAGFRTGVGGSDFAVFRYRSSDGLLDSTFDSDGILTTDVSGSSNNDQALAVAIQSNAKIVVGGSTSNGSTNDFALVRYNSDGSLDTTFGISGIVKTDFGTGSDDVINALKMQSDGKLVAAGYRTFAGVTTFALARYNTDGTLDTTFSTDGIQTSALGTAARARSIAIQSDGRILVAGSTFDQATNTGDFAIARYLTNGTLDIFFGGVRDDSLFGLDGFATTDFGSNNESANAIVLDQDSMAVAVGQSDNKMALARYNAVLSPTAAHVSISGRVLTPDGRGLKGATVTLVNSNGTRVSILTNAFGFYRFDDIEAGQTVLLNVTSKRFRFETRVVSVEDELFDVDLIAIEEMHWNTNHNWLRSKKL